MRVGGDLTGGAGGGGGGDWWAIRWALMGLSCR